MTDPLIVTVTQEVVGVTTSVDTIKVDMGVGGPQGIQGPPGDIDSTIFDAKGDLIGASAADTAVRVPAGTDGQMLVRDDSAASGIAWLDRFWTDVACLATAGTGTSADPWTGWETAVNVLPERSSLFFRKGYYEGSVTDHPENANYKQVIRFKNGWSIKGAGRGNTFIRLAASSPSQTTAITVHIALNSQITSGGDADIDVSDISFDGNAANQGTNIQNGVGALRVRRMHCQRVNVFNCQGNAPSGFGETVHFSATLSSDCTWTDCNAFTTAGTSASGFSGNSATNLKWSGCNAYGMTVTNGFTHNSCGGLTYVHCNSWLNGYYGFNSEASVDISYANCRAGGRSAIGAASWPYSANAPLGNGRHGFGLVGTSRQVTLVGCQSLGNGTSSAGSYNGFLIQDCHGVTVVGCIGSDDQSVKTQAYGLAFSGTTSTSINAVGNNWDGNLTGTVSGAGTYANDETLGHLKVSPAAPTGGVSINAQAPTVDFIDVNTSAEDWRLAVEANQLFAYSFTQAANIAVIDRLKGLLLPLADNGRGIEYHAGPREFSGTGSPEGVLTAPPGSTYRNKSGGAGASFWVKESGVGNTGWIAK